MAYKYTTEQDLQQRPPKRTLLDLPVVGPPPPETEEEENPPPEMPPHALSRQTS